jgi:flagellar basal body rod protein FlgG
VCNGYQEQSNVSPIGEMAAMIQSLREFESGHRMIQTLNELSREASQKTV